MKNYNRMPENFLWGGATAANQYEGAPFKVKDDEAMMETADSIKQYGVLVPAIARPDPEGGYELVAGHRRHRASELAEKASERPGTMKGAAYDGYFSP